MDNNNEFKEIERDVQNKDYDTIQKYGIDIKERYNTITSDSFNKKRKLRNKTLKYGIIILIFIFFLFSIYSIKQKEFETARISEIEQICGKNVMEIPVKTKINGDGIYMYKINNESDIQVHSCFIRKKNLFETDVEARFYKYYFEKWQNEEKNKFIVEEKYEDAKCGLIYEKDWILKYRTIIEVKDYEEMIDATKTIIKFIEYMGNRRIGINSYIKIENNLIVPQTANDVSNEQIMKSVIQQYNAIMQGTLKNPYTKW